MKRTILLTILTVLLSYGCDINVKEKYLGKCENLCENNGGRKPYTATIIGPDSCICVNGAIFEIDD